MVQNIFANAAQNGSTDGAMASTTNDDEINVVVKRSFHNGFSGVSLQMFKYVFNLQNKLKTESKGKRSML